MPSWGLLGFGFVWNEEELSSLKNVEGVDVDDAGLLIKGEWYMIQPDNGFNSYFVGITLAEGNEGPPELGDAKKVIDEFIKETTSANAQNLVEFANLHNLRSPKMVMFQVFDS